MSSESKRTQRVGEQIKQELAQLLVEGVKDPRIGFTTITEVRVSGDLRSARVFVSVYGDEAARRESLEGLHKAAGFLRRELGHRLPLRSTPELTFVHDDTLDHAERLDQLMQAAAHGDLEPPADEALPIVPIQTPRGELAERAATFESERQKPRPPARRRSSRSGGKGRRTR